MAGSFPLLPVWMIPPEWSNGVLERLEWLTDIFASPTGAEQRTRMRLTPRRSFDIPVSVVGPERTLYSLQIKAAGASDWYLPLWHDIVRIPAALAAGVGDAEPLPFDGLLSIALATAGHEYAPGGLVILYGDLFTWEIGIITQVYVDRLVLSLPTVADWPAGTRLMPLITARLNAEPTGTRLSDRVLTTTVSFTATTATIWPESLGGCPTYQGFPVLVLPPDESASLSDTYQRLTTLLDNQTGLTRLTDTAGFGFVAQQYRWFLVGYAEHAALRSLLYALHGRQAPLWVPTFAADLQLVAPIASADTHLTVLRCGYTDYPTTDRSELMIQLQDGTQLFASITSSVVAGDNEVLGLAAAVGRTISLAAIHRVSFMALSRQDTDVVEIAHQTDAAGVASVATVFREAPDLRKTAWDGFNAADSQDVFLSNFDLTLSNIGNNQPFARTRHGKHAGKWYFEGYTPLFANSLITNTWLGICTLDATYADMIANARKGCLGSHYFYGFEIAVCGTFPIPIIPYLETALTMGFAIDLDAKLFWFRPTPVSRWNDSDTADPAIGVGGFSFAALGGVDMYPCAVGDVDSLMWTINLGGLSFEGIPPAGFHPGWSAA